MGASPKDEACMAPPTRITKREAVLTTPYFRLIAKTLDEGGDPYYSVQTHDYVSVLAVTPAGDIPLVRQYRPAVESDSLELPSGHVDPGETPEQAAARELAEETGYAGRLELLGCLKPDTGRLGNRMWCFFAGDAERVPGPHTPEVGVDLVVCGPGDRPRLLAPPLFDHALHLAVLQMALVQGKLPLAGLGGA
jgi:ADP-ribose pyrophosphatase